MFFSRILNKAINRFGSIPAANKLISCLFAKRRNLFSSGNRHISQCFDISNVYFCRGNTYAHAETIEWFMNTYYWQYEPIAIGLGLNCQNSEYVNSFNKKFSTSGDRWIAYEWDWCTGTEIPVGLALCRKVLPWMITSYNKWASCTLDSSDKSMLYFQAHCLSEPHLFEKYNVPYIYEVAIIATATDVYGHWVGAAMLNKILDESLQLRHPLVQVTATSSYLQETCERCRMKPAWVFEPMKLVDDVGHYICFPVQQNYSPTVYIKLFDQYEALNPQTPIC